MENLYKVNNSKGVISLFLGLKSRITTVKPVLTMLMLLMVCLFGVNENAWGISQTKLTVNVSGNGTIKVNTSASEPSDAWSSSSVPKEQYNGWSIKKTDYYYIWVNPNAGYHFVNFTGDLTPSWNNAGYYETSFKGATSQVKKTITANFAANSYTISFNGNGNTSGSMSNQTGFVYGTGTKLNDNKFGRAYTVTYDANGGSCGTSSATATYTFSGWKSSDNTSYANQATISTFSPAPGHNATVTLTAQWTSTSVTLPSATKDGAVLEGWYVGSIAEGNKITTATYTPTANVTLVANWINKYNPVMTGSNQSMMVDGEQTTAFTLEHVYKPVAHISVISISSINNGDGKVIEYDAANNKIIAHNAGVAEIYFTQAETETIKKGTSATYTYTVYKYNSTFANVADKDVKVDADVASSYTLTYTKPNNAYIGTANIAAGTPVSGENANFYYTLTQNVTTAITAGSPDASKAISYNAASKTVTGKNAGTGTVHFYQPETYKYNAADASFVVTVTKNANKLYVNGAETYKPTMQLGKDLAVTLTATNTDYTGSPIQLVKQTAGDNTIAVFDYTQNTHSGTIHSKFKKDVTATWSIHQDENYKYLETNNTFSVDVKLAAENTCYVLENQSNQEDGWHGNTYHEHTWEAENVAGVVKFDIYRTWGADMGYNVQQLLNGSWQNITDYKDDFNGDWQTKTQALDPAAKGVRFRLKGGSYVHVKNVSVTRKTYLNASDLTIDKTASNAPVYPSGEKGVGTFTIDYSMANGGNLKISNDNPSKFKLSQSEISASDCSGGSANITIQYGSAAAGTDYAHLVIYNDVYRKEVTITGKTVKQTPTVTWSSNAAYFNVEDVLSATNANGLTVTLSSVGNEDYVSCDGNSATMLEATEGTITITAHVTGNGSYEDKDITKDITITNKEKQTISWDQDFSRLKTTDGTKSITLNATASSGLAVSYALVGDQTGLTLTQDGDTWTLTYSSECKNTTIIASQAGDGTYAPASSVSKTVKVIDPTKVCDESETVVNSTVKIKENDVTYNIDIPNKMYVSVSRTKQGLLDIYLVGVDFEFYDGRNGTGTQLYKKSYSASDINKSITDNEIDLSSYIHAKSVKVVTTSSNGYNIDNITYTHQKYCTISTNSLNFSTHPNTQTAALTFDVSYANYPISLECSNDKFSFTPDNFGDCSENGTQTVSVSYTAGAEEGNDVGYLYIKDNTGNTLQTCTLKVSISQLTQSITSTNIEQSYLTTDKVTLSAEANSGLTDFTYSASPAGIASFNGAEMTFAQSGTIAITVNQAGNNVYKPTSTTVSNIVVSKATPNIATNPAGTSVVYLQTLENSTLSGGAADITLHGENTSVEGTFAWKTPSQKITDNAGTHSYFVTFTPTDGDMYNTKEFTIPITITRATQAIEMNNGEVRVAVDGIDAGADDSKIDLDDLIKSQTIDQEEASRTGVVTYEVISENKAKATIGEGNIFSATAIGDYTIRATKAQTDYYSEATYEFVVSVSKRANTMTIAATEYEKFVDDEVTNIRDVQNSDATVQTSSSNVNLAYYDVANNKIVIPNSDHQMFGASTTVTIKIWQDETARFEALDTLTITLTVKKYVTAFSGENYDLLVEGTQEGQYVFENTSAEQPTANSEDDFYYTFENTTFANEALNKEVEGNNLVTYDPDTRILTAENAGATKIAFYQKETRKYTGATATYWIIVSKHTTNFSCLWDDESTEWTRLMDNNQSATVAISSNHADSPISIEQTYGEGIATLSGTAASATITSTSENGYAIWHLSQAEDYKYSSAEMDLTVAVGVPAPPTCYIVNDDTEHEFSTGFQLGVYDTPIEINAPADKIWFSAKRQTGGVNYFVAEYSVDNGTTWREICNPDLSTSYKDFGPYSFKDLQSNEFVTHIRFGAKTGATLSKWYKNVKVSRKPYINIQNAGHDKIVSLAMPTNTVGNTTTAKFYIDYSTCDGELTIASSDPHFTVDRTTISVSGDNLTETTKEEVTVTYSSDAEGNHVGVITISSSYQVAALSVSGVTNKRIQTIEWKEGFNTVPITLAVGTVVNDKNIAAEASSGNRVYYASDDETVIEIRNEGKEFAVVGEGTCTLTVSAAGNDTWSDVSVTRTVHATEKDIQEIVWEQVFPRFMAINSEVDLDAKVYIRHGNERTYSAARSASLTYTCPLNNGVISVSGNKMTILAYGETTVTANVAGNEDYEAAAPMTVAVNVRQPSQGCQTPFVLEQEGTVSVLTNYSFSSYQYLESNSEILALDKTLKGKPDKLSFQYEGEEYKILGVPVLAGHVTAQQRIDGHWSNVSGSNVEPIKNEWKSIENLQLDERADAIRFYREAGGKGTHNFKDIKITRKQYLTASVEAINVGDIKMGQTKVVNVEFDYSDMKGDLAARAENTTNGLTIANNGAIDVECGSFGHYQLPITIVPTQVGAWENTVYVKDPITNLEISVALTANVLAADEQVWNDTTDVPGTNANATIDDDLVIEEDVTLNKLTVADSVTVTIDGDVEVGSLTIEEGATVIVKTGHTLTIGDEEIQDLDAYGNLYVEDDAKLILDANAHLEVNEFTIESSIGTSDGSAVSGQVTNVGTMSFANAYIEINMDPSGVMSDSKWYGFTVPFPVDVYYGVSRKEGETYRQCVYGTHYMIAEYDANKRLQTGKGWKYITESTLVPGKFYFFTVNGNWNTYRFKSKDATYTQPAAVSLTMNGSGANANWNAVGNSMLQYVKASFGEGQYVQVYKNGLDAYLPVSISEAAFVVGCPFFIQATEETSLVLSASSSASAYYAPRRTRAQNGVARINLTSVDGGYSDQIYVSGADKEQEGYVMGHDLSKAGVSDIVPQLWIANYGQKLSVNEAAWQGDKAICSMGLYVPATGEYVLTATQPEDGTQVYLTQDGTPIWNLTMSEYTLSLNKGTDSSYGLMLVKAPKITTGTEDASANEVENVQKLILEDHVYILRNGEMYDAAGRKVK